jgi:hypothetical protein
VKTTSKFIRSFIETQFLEERDEVELIIEKKLDIYEITFKIHLKPTDGLYKLVTCQICEVQVREDLKTFFNIQGQNLKIRNIIIDHVNTPLFTNI